MGSRGKFFYGYEGRSLPGAEAKRHSAVHILATAQLLKPAHSQIHVAFVFRGFFFLSQILNWWGVVLHAAVSEELCHQLIKMHARKTEKHW